MPGVTLHQSSVTWWEYFSFMLWLYSTALLLLYDTTLRYDTEVYRRSTHLATPYVSSRLTYVTKLTGSQFILSHVTVRENYRKRTKTRMWANAQRDGRPAEHRWCPLFNAAKFGWRPLLECRAVTLPRLETSWNLQGCPKLTKRSQPLVGRSSPYCGTCRGDIAA